MEIDQFNIYILDDATILEIIKRLNYSKEIDLSASIYTSWKKSTRNIKSVSQQSNMVYCKESKINISR